MRNIMVAICILAMFSCRKSNETFTCENPESLDSATIYNKMTGSWKWEKGGCPPGDITHANKDVVATFNTNSVYTLTENSTLISQGTWSLKREDIVNWALNLNSPVQYFYGKITHCNNHLEFNDTYRDGCYNLFTKIN